MDNLNKMEQFYGEKEPKGMVEELFFLYLYHSN